MALFLYEFSDDIHLVVNENLRKNDEIDIIDTTLKSRINEITKKIGFIKQVKYNEHLKEVRNQTAAHKESNIHELYEKILAVDETLIVACALFFVHWTHELLTVTKDLSEKLESTNAQHTATPNAG